MKNIKMFWYRFLAWTVRKTAHFGILIMGANIFGILAAMFLMTTTAEDIKEMYDEKKKLK